jgi:AcrR family transcriptional regulator
VSPETTAPVRTGRGTRRNQLVASAAHLFAERGFHGVTIEEIGASVGISGPGLYKHFASKDAVLAEMLVSISQDLLDQGRRCIEGVDSPDDALRELLAFHTNFALTRTDLIRVQDRDLANLSAGEARRVRRLQRAYLELWVDVLLLSRPDLDPQEARTRTHAVFGLLNSTPHSATTGDHESVRELLQAMAYAALTS